ncbi:hypothetical protein LCGC14_1514990 [marine sediment metagenome]|uniref:Uncharacterized protein n=1 Tax=marine sediment metagenome TaxID=412755 RepID=A0A0F9JL16_9ZZZZ
MGSPVDVPQIEQPQEPEPVVDDAELSRLAAARRRREEARIGREDLVIRPPTTATTGVSSEAPVIGTGGKTTGLKIPT